MIAWWEWLDFWIGYVFGVGATVLLLVWWRAARTVPPVVIERSSANSCGVCGYARESIHHKPLVVGWAESHKFVSKG